MKKQKNCLQKCIIYFMIFAFLASFLNLGNSGLLQTKPALAADNLVANGSFEEGNINIDWGFWQNPDSQRTYKFYRAYIAAFGYGSYSMALDAAGASEDRFNAIVNTNGETNSFQVNSGTSYVLSFYAMANQEMEIGAFLQRADNYNSLTAFPSVAVNTAWKKHVISFSPTETARANLALLCGAMPAGSTLFIDGVNIIESNFVISTAEVKGKIGEKGKDIKISQINNYQAEDINIELPFYDSSTGQAGRKTFHPEEVTSYGVKMDLKAGTYSGVGRIYVGEVYIGDFVYNIIPEITEFYPSSPRADEDLAIYGSGFIPQDANTFLVVNVVDLEGDISPVWLEPSIIDSRLSQIIVRLPYGIVSGNMYLQSSFLNAAGTEVVNKSNTVNYKVKPIIFENGVGWKDQGYEHVGDKLLIHGKGMGKSPVVNFYNEDGEKIDNQRAKLIQIHDHEIIEVGATNKYNNVTITVSAGGVESDKYQAQKYSAKPIIKGVKSQYSRNLYSSEERIQAAKIGDEITVTGQSLQSNIGDTYIEFEAINGRIRTAVSPENIGRNGSSVKANVPAGAIKGFIAVIVNGQASNHIPFEIVPSVSSVSPDPLVPGEEMTIIAQGVGNNLSLAKVYFEFDRNNETAVTPNSITYSGTNAVIKTNAPMAISNQSTGVSVQYDRWRSNGNTVLNVNPAITNVGINLDNRILSIKGYGFSVNPKENIITYKYNDENKTVIEPKVRMLGVYPTEEGQEIRIQILDDYHFGFVSVSVGGISSNEVNFGPVSVRKVSRRVEYVKSVGQEMGVLYISGYNFGPEGDVKVGGHWADTHYRSDFFIIAVTEPQYLYENPVLVTKQQ